MKVTIRSPDKEIILPIHINCLPKELVENICSIHDASERIVACGIDPRDSSLSILTGDLSVRSIAPNGNLIPVNAYPEFDGRHIVMSFVDYPGIFRIRSEIAISMSESCLNEASVALDGVDIASLSIEDTYESNESDDASAKDDRA